MRSISVFLLVLACSALPAAAEKNGPADSGRTGTDGLGMKEKMRGGAQLPIDMDEPMPIGMAREGMKKGDVKEHAMKKEAVMDEMMKQEEQKPGSERNIR
ncbi:hypothetical protein SVA_2868 [Sulfurifustis variabilis]|uniref:Secreted protein n=1 Tax=Sulfurifustis variabilis TaxID=1675686 RepID=A0A1B4V7A4_9GAMM|nr:hypothetical protein [Sulfurifustis variabilis]BAU49416.1 hypothetical protein SVA_2868 [Sulfurifustis variabilis]